MTMTNVTSLLDRLAAPEGSKEDPIEKLVEEASDWLISRQAKDGHWAFELEADATIPAEYILLNHYLDLVDGETETKLATYLFSIQANHDGWSLYHGGDFDISASVKAYFALKLVGEDIDAPHMVKARDAILAHGGAAKCNVFTRYTLALFGQVPWRAVPVFKVEALLLPKWAPFHINKVSYWSRTVMVPLMILAALKPMARNPKNIDIKELFVVPAEKVRNYLTNPSGHWLGALLMFVDRMARLAEPFFPKFLEDRALDQAMAFIKERLNGE
ncbi:MAG TPA: prenyltransferase/squalene oxidase repeat-containing protein, partial [Rhodospirillales bacterium]|nr:prenyltransferase/squalene oxidase repeat-containing protein [Rhodospirillales bacterium]